MAFRTAVVTVILGTLAGVVNVCVADTPINALWNDDDGFGVFLYGRPGSCETFQYKNPPFLVVSGNGKRSEFKSAVFDTSRLEVCMRATPPNVAFCVGGTFQVSFDEASNEYVGRYNIRLSDGTTWSSAFRAQHCSTK